MSDHARHVVGMADPEIMRRHIAEARAEAIKEARAKMYQGKSAPRMAAPTSPSAFSGAAALARRGRSINQQTEAGTDMAEQMRRMRAAALRGR